MVGEPEGMAGTIRGEGAAHTGNLLKESVRKRGSRGELLP